MRTLDLLFAASQADHQRQLRSLVGQEVRYRGATWRVIDAMGEADHFGLFVQQTHASGVPHTLIVSGDDLRGIQLP